MKICPACSREHGDEHDTCLDDGVVLVRLDQGVNERAQDLIGKIIDGRYRIERIVGRGGMGTVYACRHVVVGKPFAMKVLRPGIERSEEILQRFIREAQAANAVKSRHICEMTDFGQLSSGAFYVVMELLEGMSLTRALREKRLDRRALKQVFIQIVETLDRAHRANIIHRDLKPDNVVLVHDEGDPHFVKLVDFGIAKMVQSKASSLTETGVILGTPYYMSPEQARGDELDHRSDIYAAGVMMYRAFTGRLPFVADTAMGVLTRHLTEKPELPSRVTEIDSSLERLILRCLEKKPIDRFQTMAEVANALRAIPDQARVRNEFETFDERSGAQAARDELPSVHSDPHPTPTRLATPYAKSQRRQAWEPSSGAQGASPAVTGRSEAASAPVPRSNPPPRPRSNPPASAGPTVPRFPGPMPVPEVPLSQRPLPPRAPSTAGPPRTPSTAGPPRTPSAHPQPAAPPRPPAAPVPPAPPPALGGARSPAGPPRSPDIAGTPRTPSIAGTPRTPSTAGTPLSPGAAAAAYAAQVAQYPVHTPEHGMTSGMMPIASHISSGAHQVPSGVHPVHRPVSGSPSGSFGAPVYAPPIPAMMPPPPLDGVAHPLHGEAATNRGLSARISVRPPRTNRVAIVGAIAAVVVCAVAIGVVVIIVGGTERGSPASPSGAPAETSDSAATTASPSPTPSPQPQDTTAEAPIPSTSASTAPSSSPSSEKGSSRRKAKSNPGKEEDGGDGAPGDPVDDVRDPF